MRDKEIVGLWEAYLQVHQPKEEVEQLDEFLGSGAQKFVYDATKKGGYILRKIPGVAGVLSPVRPGRGTVTPEQQKRKIKPVGEEVENWVNSLIDEGYDLSEYTWEDMYEMYVNLDEGNRGENKTNMSNVSKLRRRQKNFAAGIVHPDEAGELEGERQSTHKSRRNVPTRGSGVREEYDTFDAILEHLVAEGYADTNESALAIMANMSEEWREEILDEAVRGSGRSIGDRITGNDIRGVTRKGKTVYKKPQWKDDVENKVDREFQLLSDKKNKKKSEMDAGRLTVATKRGIEKATNRSNDGPGGGEFAPGSALRRREEDDQPTDYRARNRRARGR